MPGRHCTWYFRAPMGSHQPPTKMKGGLTESHDRSEDSGSFGKFENGVGPSERAKIHKGPLLIFYDLEWSFKSTLQGNPALAMEVIADNDNITDEVDNDPYMQSLASHNFYMFPPTLKRSDIACFPASPSILSPNVSRTASTR